MGLEFYIPYIRLFSMHPKFRGAIIFISLIVYKTLIRTPNLEGHFIPSLIVYKTLIRTPNLEGTRLYSKRIP